MKKRYIILIITVLLIAALGIWQRNNIEALIIFSTHSTEDTEKLIQENKEKLAETLKQYSDVVPRDLTPEEEAKIASGEMSIAEATEMLMAEAESGEVKNEDNSATLPSSSSDDETKTEPVKKDPVQSSTPAQISPSNDNTSATKPTQSASSSPSKNNTSTTKPSQSSTATSTKKENKAAPIIKRYTAELYSMKAYYIGQLSQIESRAKNEFDTMDPEEKRKLSKASFIAKYAGYATTLMVECDGKVNSLLSSMKQELTDAGQDTAVISTIRQAYESEKAARKAYYLNMVS